MSSDSALVGLIAESVAAEGGARRAAARLVLDVLRSQRGSGGLAERLEAIGAKDSAVATEARKLVQEYGLAGASDQAPSSNAGGAPSRRGR